MSDEYKAFIVSLHRFVVAHNEEEALSLLPTDLLRASIREVQNDREISKAFPSIDVHLPTEPLEYADEVDDLTDLSLKQLDDLNDGLSLVRSAIAQPSTFPRVPVLERTEIDILIFCRDLASGRDQESEEITEDSREQIDRDYSVDPTARDLRNYLFLRYPELQEVVILLKEEEEDQAWRNNGPTG